MGKVVKQKRERTIVVSPREVIYEESESSLLSLENKGAEATAIHREPFPERQRPIVKESKTPREKKRRDPRVSKPEDRF